MATLYSGDQQANTISHIFNKPNESGKVFRKFFSYTVSAATLAVADILSIGQIKKGERFLGGKCVYSAASVAVTAKIGTYAVSSFLVGDTPVDDDHYGALTSMSSAGAQDFGVSAATACGEEATADWDIRLLTAGAIAPAAMTIAGYFDVLRP